MDPKKKKSSRRTKEEIDEERRKQYRQNQQEEMSKLQQKNNEEKLKEPVPENENCLLIKQGAKKFKEIVNIAFAPSKSQNIFKCAPSKRCKFECYFNCNEIERFAKHRSEYHDEINQTETDWICVTCNSTIDVKTLDGEILHMIRCHLQPDLKLQSFVLNLERSLNDKKGASNRLGSSNCFEINQFSSSAIINTPPYDEANKPDFDCVKANLENLLKESEDSDRNEKRIVASNVINYNQNESGNLKLNPKEKISSKNSTFESTEGKFNKETEFLLKPPSTAETALPNNRFLCDPALGKIVHEKFPRAPSRRAVNTSTSENDSPENIFVRENEFPPKSKRASIEQTPFSSKKNDNLQTNVHSEKSNLNNSSHATVTATSTPPKNSTFELSAENTVSKKSNLEKSSFVSTVASASIRTKTTSSEALEELRKTIDLKRLTSSNDQSTPSKFFKPNATIPSESNLQLSNELKMKNKEIAKKEEISHQTRISVSSPLKRNNINMENVINCQASTSKASNQNKINYTKELEMVSSIQLMPWIQEGSLKNRNNKKYKICYRNMTRKTSLSALYKCMGTECSFATNSVSHFFNHILHHEKESSGKPEKNFYCCAYCLWVFKKAEDLVHHITDVHSMNVYQCAYCFYRSKEKESCYFHILKTHSNHHIKFYKCSHPEITEEKVKEHKARDYSRLIDKRKKHVSPIICKSESEYQQKKKTA